MHYSKSSHLRTYSSFPCLQLFSLSAPHCKTRDPASKAKWPPPERDLAEEVTGQAQGPWCIPVLPSTCNAQVWAETLPGLPMTPRVLVLFPPS